MAVKIFDKRFTEIGEEPPSEDGQLEVVKMLLKAKVIDVNVRNNDGNTAFMLAARMGQLAVIDMLLEEKEINVAVQNNQGMTANLLFQRWQHFDENRLLEEVKETDVNN